MSPTGMSALHKQLLPGALLFLVVLGTFWPAVHNDFVGYDDPVYVTGNGHVQQGLSWKTVKWAFTTSEGGNWHPLTWISHMIDCQLFGVSPSEHHFASIVIHALNAVLVFVALFNLTGELWRSYVVAAFFGLHPLRVESVAWIAERKDVLSTFFFLITLLAYARYISRKSQGREKSVWPYRLCLVFFALGLLSKPMLVTLPFVLLLLDYWPLRRFEEAQKLKSGGQTSKIEPPSAEASQSKLEFPVAVNLLIEKLSFFLIASIVGIITFAVQRKGGAMTLVVPFYARVENALISYCRYIAKTFYPVKLAVFYPYEFNWPIIAIVLAAILLAAITVAAFLWRRQCGYLFTGWLWFVGTLIPVIGLVQVGEQAMADRYTYIPSIGLFLALVWGAHDLMRRWRFHDRFCGAFAAALAVVCIVKTRDQIGLWKNNETLFTHAAGVTQKNYIAHNNLGVTFERAGHLEEAASEFRQALADKPDYAQAHKNMGVVFERKGDFTNAVQEYRTAISLNPNLADAYNALGAFFSAHDRLDEAIKEFQEALVLKPDYPEAHFNLGVAYGRKGQVDAVIREYLAVIEVQPNRADVHNNLGVALDSQGRTDEAIQEYVQAIELEPSYARARFNLGVALSRKGAIAPAIEQYQEALKLKPDYAEARTNLNILLKMGETH